MPSTFAADQVIENMASFRAAVPSAHELRLAREWLMLSQHELAHCLGFKPSNGGDIIRRWEGNEIAPSAGAWTAFRYLLGLVMEWRYSSNTAQKERIERILPGIALR